MPLIVHRQAPGQDSHQDNQSGHDGPGLCRALVQDHDEFSRRSTKGNRASSTPPEVTYTAVGP